MIEDSTTPVLVGITRKELEDELASAFEYHRGRGYAYNDVNYDSPASYVIIYDKILSRFDDNQREIIENQIHSRMSQPGVHIIMDQGCGHANTLNRLTHRFAKQYPAGKFVGYGVSGDLKAMWLGHPRWHWDLTDEDKRLIEKYGIYPFDSHGSRNEDCNVNFYGIEDDIHKVMKYFPYKLDLVVSDNTYFHLLAPWMALKLTADKLSVGGITIVRTINDNVNHISQRPISHEILLKLLKKDNPDYDFISPSSDWDHRILAVIKKGEADLKTNFHMSWVSEGESRYMRSFYSKNPKREDLVAVDTF